MSLGEVEAGSQKTHAPIAHAARNTLFLRFRSEFTDKECEQVANDL
jgi:hypothetical protein